MVIPGYTNYDISEAGVITRLDTGKVLSHYLYTSIGGVKSYRVSLVDKKTGEYKVFNVMRLLALTYLPPRPNSSYVASAKDGNNLNVCVDNVEWRSREAASKASYSASLKTRKKKTSKHCTPESVETLYDAMVALDEPKTASALSIILEVPYSTIRYSMIELLRQKKVRQTRDGYVVRK